MTSLTALASTLARTVRIVLETITTTIVPTFIPFVNDSQVTTIKQLQSTLSPINTNVSFYLHSTDVEVTTTVLTQCTCNDKNNFLDNTINVAVVASTGGMLATAAFGIGIYIKYLKQGN